MHERAKVRGETPRTCHAYARSLEQRNGQDSTSLAKGKSQESCKKRPEGVASEAVPIPERQGKGSCQEMIVSAGGKGHGELEKGTRRNGKACLMFTMTLGRSGLPEEDTFGWWKESLEL